MQQFGSGTDPAGADDLFPDFAVPIIQSDISKTNHPETIDLTGLDDESNPSAYSQHVIQHSNHHPNLSEQGMSQLKPDVSEHDPYRTEQNPTIPSPKPVRLDGLRSAKSPRPFQGWLFARHNETSQSPVLATSTQKSQQENEDNEDNKDIKVNHEEDKELQHKELQHKEPPHKEPPHKEPPHKEPPHKEPPHKEPPHKEQQHIEDIEEKEQKAGLLNQTRAVAQDQYGGLENHDRNSTGDGIDGDDGEILIVDPQEAAKLDAFKSPASLDSLSAKVQNLQLKYDAASEERRRVFYVRQLLVSKYKRLSLDLAEIERKAIEDSRFQVHFEWTRDQLVKADSDLRDILAKEKVASTKMSSTKQRLEVTEFKYKQLYRRLYLGHSSPIQNVADSSDRSFVPVDSDLDTSFDSNQVKRILPQSPNSHQLEVYRDTKRRDQGHINIQTTPTFQPPALFQPFQPFNPYGLSGQPEVIDLSEDRYAIPESADIRDLIDNIQPDEEQEEDGLPKTPDDLRLTLLKHQRIGLSWLLRMENSKGKGGILADDMGLGKTIQAIALMMANKSPDESHKTTLIVAPVSLLRQWHNEIKNHSKVPLVVGMYHGPKRRKEFRSFADFQKCDVVMTSYTTLANEFKLHYSKVYEDSALSMGLSQVPDHGIGGETYSSPFYKRGSNFYRIFLDEAQNIKNRLSLTSKSVAALASTYRFCLTGTPMQNNIDELYPIIRFLKIKPYLDEHAFARRISIPLKNQSSYNADASMKKLRALLKAILLRRSKDSTIDGKPILSLPKKHVVEVRIKMDEDELNNYKSIEANTKSRARTLFANSGNFSSFLVLLLRLRQACCHVFLCELGSVGKFDKYRNRNSRLFYNSIARLSKLEVQAIYHEISSSLSDELSLRDQKDNLLDITVGQKEKSPIDEIELIDTTDLGWLSGSSDSKLLKSEVGTQPIKNEVKDSTFPSNNGNVVKNEASGDDSGDEMFTCPICFIPSSYQAIIRFPCHHKVCEECIEGYIKEHEWDDGSRVQCHECSSSFKTTEMIDYRIFSMKHFEHKSKEEIFDELLRNLSQGSSISAKIEQLIMKYKTFEYSSKMEKAIELIQKIFIDFPDEKIIVFSQFTSYLELLKIMFNEAKIPTLRYDGTMSVDKKDATVGEFYNNDRFKIMLTSLKAGNVGLTLNCASHVIIMDPFWNPFVEEQAMDRAHRIGQTKEVHVYKILVEDTVEMRILELQKKKQELIQLALDEKEMRLVSRLSREDLQYLFGFGVRGQEG